MASAARRLTGTGAWRPTADDLPEPWRTPAVVAALRAIEVPYPFAPGPSLVFRALSYVGPADIRVVILGQDPYPQKGKANGLAFGVNPDWELGKPAWRDSLANIADEVLRSTRSPLRDRSLDSWARQGVLLLNTCLTVAEDGPARSHSRVAWAALVQAVLNEVVKQAPCTAWLLWGKEAQALAPKVLPAAHKPFEASHPSPFSAKGFIGRNPFLEANKFLEYRAIDWSADRVTAPARTRPTGTVEVVNEPIPMAQYLPRVMPAVNGITDLLAGQAAEYWRIRLYLVEQQFDLGFNQYAADRLRSEREGDWEDYQDRADELADELPQLVAEFGSIEAAFREMRTSAQCLSGALLQIGHQCLSRVWPGLGPKTLPALPEGRLVYGVPVRDLIWYGRNQSAHPFDGTGPAVAALTRMKEMIREGVAEDWHGDRAADFAKHFNLAAHESVADEIVRILEWDKPDAFEADLMAYERL